MIEASGTLTVTTPVTIVSARRGRLVVRIEGHEQVVYVGGTLAVTSTVVVKPQAP